jgi:glycosyltransferase involved in cell wall biosynthesis
MVKDEDLHIEMVIRNCVDFCDLLLVADHGSTDQTYAILTRLAEVYPTIQLSRITHAWESHVMIQAYAGTETWVFGVDGDEIYDPQGLKRFRAQLLAGKFDDCWEILGNVLHCEMLDRNTMVARGYLAPPAISMTKLYNFSKISKWTNCPQRLHWGEVSFNGDANRTFRLCDELPWADSAFRCLHVAFLRRSSLQNNFKPWHTTRYNLSEMRRNSWLDWSLGRMHVLKQIFLYPLTRLPRLDYKYRRYRKGDQVTLDAYPFLGPAGAVASTSGFAASGTEGMDGGIQVKRTGSDMRGIGQE